MRHMHRQRDKLDLLLKNDKLDSWGTMSLDYIMDDIVSPKIIIEKN